MASAPDLDDALRALNHPARRALVRLCGEAEQSAGELADRVGLRQPTASQHLKVLREAGLLVVRVDGNRRLYRVGFEQIARVREALDALWPSALAQLKAAAERRAAQEES